MTAERYQPWSLTPFESWVKEEGLRVYSQQVVPNINAIELAPWERTGTKVAILDLTPEPGRRHHKHAGHDALPVRNTSRRLLQG